MKPLKTTKKWDEAMKDGSDAIDAIKYSRPVYTEKELREDCDRFMNTMVKPGEAAYWSDS